MLKFNDTVAVQEYRTMCCPFSRSLAIYKREIFLSMKLKSGSDSRKPIFLPTIKNRSMILSGQLDQRGYKRKNDSRSRFSTAHIYLWLESSRSIGRSVQVHTPDRRHFASLLFLSMSGTRRTRTADVKRIIRYV